MPATTYSVMVSSTTRDLPEHREAVIKAINAVQWIPVAMDFKAVGGQSPLQFSYELVDEADIYVGIFALYYGSIPVDATTNPGGLSFTELEYRYALKQGKTVIPFIMDRTHPMQMIAGDVANFIETDPDKLKKLNALRSEIMTNYAAGMFTSVDNLNMLVFQALEALKKKLTP